MTEQAQAEDRRLQLMVDLDAIIHKRADCLRIQEAAAIAEAIAELTRLSRVEQALREQFTNLLASATQLVDSHPGRFRYLEYDVRALSASPEAQPEEGR